MQAASANAVPLVLCANLHDAATVPSVKTSQMCLQEVTPPCSPPRRLIANQRSASTVRRLLREAEAQDSSFKRRASPHFTRSPSSASRTPRSMVRQFSSRSLSMEFPVRSVSPVAMSPQSSFCESSANAASHADMHAPSLVQFVELMWSPGLEVFELHGNTLDNSVHSVTKRQLRLSSAGKLFWGPESKNPADIVRRLVLSRSLTPRSINELEVSLDDLISARVLGLEACIGKSDESTSETRLALFEICFVSHSIRLGVRGQSYGLSLENIVERLCDLQREVRENSTFRSFVGLQSA